MPELEQAPTFTESLNFKVSPALRERMDDQAKRLDQSITSLARMALALGVEAIEKLTAAKALEQEKGAVKH